MFVYGKVAFFDNAAGWGKIISDGGEELFVHHRDIVDKKFYPANDIEKFRTLKRGQRVMFKIEQQADKPMNSVVELELVNG